MSGICPQEEVPAGRSLEDLGRIHILGEALDTALGDSIVPGQGVRAFGMPAEAFVDTEAASADIAVALEAAFADIAVAFEAEPASLVPGGSHIAAALAVDSRSRWAAGSLARRTAAASAESCPPDWGFAQAFLDYCRCNRD
ncbi:MAG: hypothetical protein QG577_348 [Thermodesulfobacteriota bacterium]|nr:hypothetical protein [Thermodesulfobacteriota bacterium]